MTVTQYIENIVNAINNGFVNTIPILDNKAELDEIDAVLRRVLTMMPGRLSPAKGRVQFTGMLVDIDEESGKATSIERIIRDGG